MTIQTRILKKIEALLMAGWTVPQIGTELGLSSHNVRRFIQHDADLRHIALVNASRNARERAEDQRRALAARAQEVQPAPKTETKPEPLRRSVRAGRPWNTHPDPNYRDRRPAVLWHRYDVIHATDGFMIIDRMSEKWSTPYEWRSGEVEILIRANAIDVARKVRQMNRAWHQYLLKEGYKRP